MGAGWECVRTTGIMPVVGTNSLKRIANIADALKVTLDRETWFELWTLAQGKEVP